MRTWHVCLPCWGVEYIDRFFSGPVDCLIASLRHANRKAVLLVVTDHPEYFEWRMSRSGYRGMFELRVFPKPEPDRTGNKYEMFGEAHRVTLASLPHGEYAVPFCADQSVSVEFIKACEKRLDSGFEVVSGFGPSSLPPFPAPGLSGRALAEHGVTRMHPRHAAHIWPSTGVASMVMIRDANDGVVAHAFHQHPFAVKVTEKLARWKTGSCDAGLDEMIGIEGIHTVIDPAECSVVETSPEDTPVNARREPLTVHDVVNFGMKRAGPVQRKLFERRIVLTGTGKIAPEQRKIEQIVSGIR